MAPNCQQHEDCDLVCPWDGYYCHNEAHEWSWRHICRYDPNHGHLAPREAMDMPDLNKLDLEHDMGLRDLTDPFTGEYVV